VSAAGQPLEKRSLRPVTEPAPEKAVPPAGPVNAGQALSIAAPMPPLTHGGRPARRLASSKPQANQARAHAEAIRGAARQQALASRADTGSTQGESQGLADHREGLQGEVKGDRPKKQPA